MKKRKQSTTEQELSLNDLTTQPVNPFTNQPINSTKLTINDNIGSHTFATTPPRNWFKYQGKVWIRASELNWGFNLDGESHKFVGDEPVVMIRKVNLYIN